MPVFPLNPSPLTEAWMIPAPDSLGLMRIVVVV
jgi:hypothetical protein